MELVYILGGIFGVVLVTFSLASLLCSGERERAPASDAKGDLPEAVHHTSSCALRPWVL